MVDSIAELPISVVGVLNKLPYQGFSSITSEFISANGKKYVHKEYKPKKFYEYDFPGKTLQQKASAMNKYHHFLQEVLGEYVTPTLFIVANNTEGEERIMMIQEKIDGVQLNKLGRTDQRRKKANGQYAKISEKVEDLRHGITYGLTESQIQFMKGFKDVPYIINDAKEKHNIMVDNQGNLHLVDW